MITLKFSLWEIHSTVANSFSMPNLKKSVKAQSGERVSGINKLSCYYLLIILFGVLCYYSSIFAVVSWMIPYFFIFQIFWSNIINFGCKISCLHTSRCLMSIISVSGNVIILGVLCYFFDGMLDRTLIAYNRLTSWISSSPNNSWLEKVRGFLWISWTAPNSFMWFW